MGMKCYFIMELMTKVCVMKLVYFYIFFVILLIAGMVDLLEAAHYSQVAEGNHSDAESFDVIKKPGNYVRNRSSSVETEPLSSDAEGSSVPVSRSSIGSNERDSIGNGEITNDRTSCFELNDIERLIEMKTTGVSLIRMGDINDYIRSHYVHSFEDLNEAARLGVMIAARNGDAQACCIVADVLNYDDKLPDVDAKLCRERNEKKTQKEKFDYNLTVPFSMNYDKNWRYIASREGREYIQRYFRERRFERENNPIILLNLGCALLNAGDSEHAFTCFYEAGKRGMPRGYIKAAQLVVDGKSVDYSCVDGLDAGASIGDKVRHIVKDAGEQGQWYLATCSRYGKLMTESHYYDQYHLIVNKNKQNPQYLYEYGLLHVHMAKHETSVNSKKEAYGIALACFMNAMRVGQHGAYKDVKEVLHVLKTLDSAFEGSDQYSEVIAATQKSAGVLEEFSIKSNKILDDLLAE